MLRACAISFPEKWDGCLKLAEFLTIIATKKASAWHYLKLYMEESVGHHLTGLKWETMDTLGQISSKRLESK